MTREEAFKKAINIVAYFEAHFAKSKEAREDAVNIIEVLEQEPCEDVIRREDAISAVSEALEHVFVEHEGIAKKMINKLASVKPQESCKDAINRAKALEAIRKLPHTGWLVSTESVLNVLSELPSVTPQPKTGHWIREKERHFLDTRTNENVEMKEATGKGYHTYINVQCSKCRKITIHDDSILYQYCPHCGAKMIEPQERSSKT